MYTGMKVKYSLFLSYFDKAWIVSKGFQKILQVWNVTKNHLLGAEFFHASRQTHRRTEGRTDARAGERRTEISKLRVTFCNFSEHP